MLAIQHITLPLLSRIIPHRVAMVVLLLLAPSLVWLPARPWPLRTPQP
jgi:hypothetical protein